jgi:ATP-dependent Lon protease
MVRYHTREAGRCRNLERELAGIARKAVREIVDEKSKKVAVTVKNLDKFAGVAEIPLRRGEAGGHGRASSPASPGPRWAARS